MVKNASELRTWLQKMKHEDFHNGNVKRYDKPEMPNGTMFITDFLGNDLSLCEKISQRDTRDWRKQVRLVEVLIPNCLEQYGSAINGPFEVPEKI